jgi:hypothetical protein
MKIVVIFLLVCAASGLAGGITGVKRYRSSSVTGPEVTHYDPLGRAGVLLFGVTSLTAAWGCWKRRKFGWYITITMMGAAIGITAWGIVMILAASWSSIPTALWWSAQTVAMGFLIRWWLGQKQYFEPQKKPNQSITDNDRAAPGRV